MAKLKLLRDECLTLKGQVVDLAIAGSIHRGTLRDIGGDYLVFYKEGNPPTFFNLSTVIWIRKAIDL